MIIDATDLLLGRMAAFVAKKALLGEQVTIINCEKAVISGNRERIFADYKQNRDRGTHVKGPFVLRLPDRIVKRTIRGMLPYKKPRGLAAYKSIKCYIGLPDELKDKKAETLKACNVEKTNNLKYVSVNEISKYLGAKIK